MNRMVNYRYKDELEIVMSEKFKALVVREVGEEFKIAVEEKTLTALKQGLIRIKVSYSSLNFKDALSASGVRFITKNYPHTTGIDAAGVIVESTDPNFKHGELVIVTGFDLGMDTDGGHAEYIDVPPEWVVHLPEGLTLKEAMILGTAGFTAGLSVMEVIKRGIKPSDGPVIVSGATGGVGSVAVKILSKLGYEVHAISISHEFDEYLTQLGAQKIYLASEFEKEEEKGVQLLEPVFSAAIDSVGGQILSTIIKKLKYHGIATTCGLVNGIELDLTIFAFINRGIQVSGIDSVWFPMNERDSVWNHLATDWKLDLTDDMYTQIELKDLNVYIDKILKGKMKGRGLVKVQ